MMNEHSQFIGYHHTTNGEAFAVFRMKPKGCATYGYYWITAVGQPIGPYLTAKDAYYGRLVHD